MGRTLNTVTVYLLCVLLSQICAVALSGDCSIYGELRACECTQATNGSLLQVSCVNNALNRIPQVSQTSPNVTRSFVYNISLNYISAVYTGQLSWLAGKNIRAIDLSRNQIRYINATAFSGITAELLDLSGNGIVTLSCEVFLNFSSTTFLLSDNKIVDPCNFTRCMTTGSNSLRINLNNNSIVALSSRCFAQSAPTGAALTIELASNNISYFDGDSLANGSVVVFDISNNSLSDSLLSGIVAMFSKLKVESKPSRLIMTNNRIKSIDVLCNQTKLVYSLDFNEISSVPTGCAVKLMQYNATVARLTNNPLVGIPDGFAQGLELVSDLQLPSNSLSRIGSSAFKNLTSLLRLDLSWNVLGSTDSTFFDSLCLSRSSLVELDLSYNSIKNVPPSIFDKCVALSSLNLAGNKLTTIAKESFPPFVSVLTLHHNNINMIFPGTFIKLPRLKTLDISFNNMTKLDAMDYNSSMECLLFRDNPFKCSCDLVEQLTSMHMTDFGSATCITDEQLTQDMGHFLTASCTIYLSPTTPSPGFSEAKVAGILIAVTLLMLSIGGAVWFIVKKRATCTSYSKAGGYNAMDDGDTSFSDAQGFKFTAKPDRLQLLNT